MTIVINLLCKAFIVLLDILLLNFYPNYSWKQICDEKLINHVYFLA